MYVGEGQETLLHDFEEIWFQLTNFSESRPPSSFKSVWFPQQDFHVYEIENDYFKMAN